MAPPDAACKFLKGKIVITAMIWDLMFRLWQID
jgi:hypothetical protein